MDNNLLIPDGIPQAVFPLVAVTGDNDWHPLGSAFVVAVADPRTALLLTATHNLDYAARLERPRPLHHPTTPDLFRVHEAATVTFAHTRVFAVLPQPEPPAIADLVRAWALNGHDISLLLVTIPNSHEPRFHSRLPLDLSPVAVGTKLQILGYSRMAPEPQERPRADGKTDIGALLHLSADHRTASVTEECPSGTELAKWPGFYVDAPFDSGMSGGPLIEVRANEPVVRGIVCSDLSAPDALTDKPFGTRAFGSVLWPSLLTPLDFTFEVGASSAVHHARSLADLISARVITDLGNAVAHIAVRRDNGLLYCGWRP